MKDGKSWDKESRAEFIKNTYNVVEEYAPGFSKSVVHEDILFPPDLEEIFGLTGGNIFHGALSLNSLFFSRPMPGYSNYNSPFGNLYMCGSGAHPGGGVMGAPGRSCALQVLDSLKKKGF